MKGYSGGRKFILLSLILIFYPSLYLSADEAMYKIKCTKCHPLPDPLAFSSFDWAGVVNRMAKNVPLTDAERDYIINLNSAVLQK